MTKEGPAPIVRAVVVDCHIQDVLAYLADPANDHAWCPAARAQIVAERPARVTWLEEGIAVSCELEAVWTATRVIQREPAPRGRLRRLARRRAMARRLRALRQALER